MEPRNLALTKNGVKDIARSRFFNSLLTFQRDSGKEERKKKVFSLLDERTFSRSRSKSSWKKKGREEKRVESSGEKAFKMRSLDC